LQGALRDFGVATRREVEDLDLRVRQLEHRVALLEGAKDAAPSESGDSEAGVSG
jgi:hypothetical protein